MSTHFSQSHSRLVHQWIKQLGSVSCPLDAKLVCRDGTLLWNSLLLSQWSALFKNHLAEEAGTHCDVCESPSVVAMLPDVTTDVLSRVLGWAGTGTVSLASLDEVVEVRSALIALDISVPVSYSKSSRWGSSTCERCGVSFPSEQDLTAHRLCCCRRQLMTDDIRRTKKAAKRNRVLGMLYPDCQVCSGGELENTGAMRRHLANVHFRRDVLGLFGQGDTCSLCGAGLHLERSKKGRSREVTRHMMRSHLDAVAKAMPEELRRFFSMTPKVKLKREQICLLALFL